MITALLERRTGDGIEAWNRRVVKTGIDSERELRSWLVTPRWAFALVRATTRQRVDPGPSHAGRAADRAASAVPRGVGQEAFVRAIALTALEDVDEYVAEALARAYRENA